jgi:hypothetical protein
MYEAIRDLTEPVHYQLRKGFPSEENMFINRRIVNQDNKKIAVPHELPVPKLYEIRLEEPLAKELSDILRGKAHIAKVPRKPFEKDQDASQYYREQSKEAMKPWTGVADLLDRLKTLGKGTWVNKSARKNDSPERDI